MTSTGVLRSGGPILNSELAQELDRQLSEQRAAAEALATRAGLLIAATAAIVGFSASAGTAVQSPVGYWMIGLASVLGIFVFWMARPGVGPTIAVVVNTQDASMLMNSKMILVEANTAVLTRAQLVFTAQVVLTIAGIVYLSIALWPIP